MNSRHQRSETPRAGTQRTETQRTETPRAGTLRTETQRTVSITQIAGNPVVQARLVHHYEAAPAEVWVALTDPAALERWFHPLSGDLHVGGTFHLEGNAGGEVLACVPGRVVRVSFGSPPGIVLARLDPGASAGSTLTLEHSVPLSMAGSGAGALALAPAWEMSVVGLGVFLGGDFVQDPLTWRASPGMQRFARQSIDAWAIAVELSETASAVELSTAVAASIAEYAPDVP